MCLVRGAAQTACPACSVPPVPLMRADVRQVVEAQARSYGCTGEVDWLDAQEPIYPPTVNDPGAYDFSAGVAVRCGAQPPKPEAVLPTIQSGGHHPGGRDALFLGKSMTPTGMLPCTTLPHGDTR